MKKILSILICIAMIFAMAACSEQKEETSESKEPAKVKEKNTVVLLATGGTIAGSGEQGKETGYKSGAVSIDSIVDAVPGIEDLANIEAVQVCNVNSDDITSEIWIDLANKINKYAKDPNVSGIVITHGTDTMEETAYFLNLTVKTDKPVVLTGSMRPSTATSPDGPNNLYQAVCVAASKEARGKGVMVAFSDMILSARSVMKASTYNVMAITAGDMGAMGIVRDDTPYFYEEPTKAHTTDSEFDVSKMTSLPDVAIQYFGVDADPDILKYAASHSDGIVIAGAGAGEFSEEYIDVIKGLSVPVVISSRIDDGIITQNAVLCENTIAANNLSPQKAAILLRLALTKTSDQDKLIEIFSKY